MNFHKKVLICVACSLLLGAAYYYYSNLAFPKYSLSVVLDVEVNTDASLQDRRLDLYIIVEDTHVRIKSSNLETNNNTFRYFFEINEDNSDFKIIRLDFENFIISDKITIKRLEVFKKSGESILKLKENNIVRSIYNYSNSIGVTENSINFIDSNEVFDPFILFNLKSLLFNNMQLQIILLLPWFITFTMPIYRWINQQFETKNFEIVLISMLLIVLPLKIAWLTFITILFLITSLIRFILNSQRVFATNTIQVIFISVFLLYVIFGQVKQPSDISLQLAFVLMPLIFILNNTPINLFAFYKIYIQIFTILTALIVINGLIFIILLNEYYDIPIQYYFLTDYTKLLNQKMMWWLPYSHPTFLSSFFLVGLCFCLSLYGKKLINKNLFILYFVFSLFAIVLLGSRIMLIMLIVFILYFLMFFKKTKPGIAFLLIITIALIFGLMFGIKSLDSNRSKLWGISYKAISENLYGYGVGSSKEILTNPHFYDTVGDNFPPLENHSHNQFITILLELGIIAFIIFSFIISYLGYVLYKKTDFSFILIYLIFLVLLFTESLFKTATPIYYYTFIFCLSSVYNKDFDFKI